MKSRSMVSVGKALIVSVVVITVLMAVACGSGDPTPTPRATSTPTPTATAVPGVTPQPTPTPDAMAQFQAEWEALIVAAQAEGELQLEEPLQIATCTELLLNAFKSEFNIDSTMTTYGGSTLRTRVFAEQAAGRYLWDFSGMSQGAIGRELLPGNALDPIKPLLIHPEVLDESQWFGDRHQWVDEERRFAFVHASRVTEPPFLLYYNTDLFDPNRISSYWDLLEPDLATLTVAGTPVGLRTTYIDIALHPDLGVEWMEAFLNHPDIVFLDDGRQYTDFVMKGSRPIGLLPPSSGRDAFNHLAGLGAPVAQLTDSLKERSMLSPGGTGANLIMYKNPPHPNATKLFINWFLTHEVQTMKHEQCEPGRRTIQPSLRKGVPPGNTEPSERWGSGDYHFTGAPEIRAQEAAMGDLVREVWASR